MAKKPDLATRAVGVKTVKTKELHPNPHNPRLLFDRVPLDVLKDSINKVGILVPLTVYFDEKFKGYVILDGQRRWVCASELGLAEVPVNEVAKPNLVQNIVTMFQIHKFREDWELMPTALKLELLMAELKEKNDKKISQLTGLDPAVVSRCKKLLTYPVKYRDMMIDADPSNRIKADFFIELYVVRTDRFVNEFDWFDRDAFTDAMLERYLEKKLKSVTDFRIIKQHINAARKANAGREISKRLRAFMQNSDLGIDSLAIQSATNASYATTMTKKVDALEKEVEAIDVDVVYGEEVLWKSLERLVKTVRHKLAESGRRFK